MFDIVFNMFAVVKGSLEASRKQWTALIFRLKCSVLK